LIPTLFRDAPHDVGPRPLFTAAGPVNGPPLVMLHGVLRGWRDFAPLWPALWPCWQVIGVDQRGHGRSGRTPGSYHVRDYAADGLALVNLLGDVVIYGHSLGALVAAHVAATLPHRVRAVILEDPPASSMINDVHDSPWYDVWRQMRRITERRSGVHEAARELAEIRLPNGRLGDVRDATSLRFSARCLHDLDPEVYDPLLSSRWLEGFDYDGAFAGVRCPALILRGDERLGGMLSRAEAGRLTALMAQADVVDVAGAGHLIHWQACEATSRLVLGFLESL
jgi:pimeloyl-ACP methyl ester carboxylesterase